MPKTRAEFLEELRRYESNPPPLRPPPPLESGSDKFRYVPAIITLTAIIDGKEYPGDLPGYIIEDLVDPPLSFAELCAEANRGKA